LRDTADGGGYGGYDGAGGGGEGGGGGGGGTGVSAFDNLYWAWCCGGKTRLTRMP